MAGYLHHTALNVADYEEKIRFFTTVFGMSAVREEGEKPHRKIWFGEGIQLNEISAEEEGTLASGLQRTDHLGFQVDSVEETLKKAEEFGMERIPGKAHWFRLGETLVFELKEKS